MKRVNVIIATGFGLGYISYAPGTWGTLLGIPVAYVFSFFSCPIQIGLVGVLILISMGIAHEAEKYFGKKDAKQIVIDEICGMAITLTCVPLTFSTLVFGFILFRLGDVFKFFPANVFEKKYRGGFGIVMDDVCAGIYARLLLEGLRWLAWI